jgi:hypothetical protein
MALATQGWGLFRRDGVVAAGRSEEMFQRSLKSRSDNAWAHNWRGLVLHAVERSSRIAEHELHEAIRYNKNIPPFHRNLARVVSETNISPFLRLRNEELIQSCKRGLNLCPPESYWNWDGLRAELEALLYYAESLKQRKLPDGTRLAGVESALDDEAVIG